MNWYYTWVHVFRSELEGGHNGPLDAYRHTLASAVVSYTLDKRVVDGVSSLMESGNKRSNKMDKHNNRIGAKIGDDAESFLELEPKVRKKIADGAVSSTDENRVSWLPKAKWRSSSFW